MGYEYAICVKDNSYTPLLKAPGETLFTFAFVRNPLTWYHSYWRNSLKRGWGETSFDMDCRSSDFSTFVDQMLLNYAGYATNIFDIHTNFTSNPISYIGKHEDLTSSLKEALILAKEDFPPSIIDNLPPVVKSNYDLSILYRKDQLEAIALADKETFDFFGYKDFINGQ
jgi:hypothetical protein